MGVIPDSSLPSLPYSVDHQINSAGIISTYRAPNQGQALLEEFHREECRARPGGETDNSIVPGSGSGSGGRKAIQDVLGGGEGRFDSIS